MRSTTRVWLLLVAIICPGLCAAQSANDKGEGPRIVITPHTIDFSYVMPSDYRDQEIVISNAGDSALTVTNIESNSPAFATQNVSYPFTLRPGEATSVLIRFAPYYASLNMGILWTVSNARAEDTLRAMGVRGATISVGRSTLESTTPVATYTAQGVELRLGSLTAYELDLYDATGRFVRRLLRNDASTAAIEIRNGALPVGLYHYVLRMHGSRHSGKLVLR